MSIPCLFVAEKPSIAKVISETLSQGAQRHRASASQYNPVYDFPLELSNSIDPGTFPGRLGCKLQVSTTSVSGHLMGVEFENKAMRNWRSTKHRELFDAALERIITPGSEQVANNLAIESRRARVLVIWTDCDREGEAIGEEICIQCRASNPGLVVRRAVFSAANQQDLWRAVNNTRALDMRQVDAVNARQEIDLRLGAVFTRFQSLTLGDAISQLDGKTISFGPCQFPTLGFIVARYEAILAFQPESFWQIKLTYNDTFHFNWHRHRLFDYVSALTCYQVCVAHPECTVEQVTRRPTSKRAPIPLSTVELQIRASKWLKLDSEVAMKAAEALYQRGIISYPRTETEQFSETFDLKALIQNLTASPQFGAHAARLVDDADTLYCHPRPGPKNDQAHPPIHPLKLAPDLHDVAEVRVYEFVCRHFLACCSRDAVGFESAIKAKCGAEHFTIKGLQVTERNYLDVYIYDRWGERAIPDTLVEGSVFVPSELLLTKGDTTAPELLTEAELIRLMDKHGIGTDATIADHIKTVQEREYVSKQQPGNRFAPSNLGVALIRAYNAMGHENVFSRPSLRSQMEADLKLICSGHKTKEQVVQETVTKYRNVFIDVLRKRGTLKSYVESVFMMHGMGEEEGGQEQQRYDVLLQAGFSVCGVCHAPALELRKSSRDGKIGLCCAQCARGEVVLGPLPSHAMELSPRTEHCPICHFQVVNAVISATNAWPFCPFCFVNPSRASTSSSSTTAPALGDLEDAGGDLLEMPCYKCTMQSCALSGGMPQDPIMPCIDACGAAGGVMELRKQKSQGAAGSVFYTLKCKNHATCKATLRFPSCVKEVSLPDGGASPPVCSHCGARKLQFKLVMSKVPPGTPPVLVECPNYRACRAQSMDFKSILEMEGMNFRPAAAAPPSTAVSIHQKPPPPPQQQQQQVRNTGVAASARQVQPSAHAAPFRQQAPPPSQSRQQAPPIVSQPPMRHAAMPIVAAPVPPSFRQQQQPQQQTGKACNGCGQITPERVASTQANAGRVFYKCDACGVFEWKDQPPQPSQQPQQQVQQQYHQPQPQQQQQQPACYHCGARGHFPVQCPQKNAPAPLQQQQQHGSKTSATCFRCHQPGHWANQCPNSLAPAASAAPFQQAQQIHPPPPPANSSLTCYKCKQPGHFANACPGPMAAVKPQPGRKKQPGPAAAASGGGGVGGARKTSAKPPRTCSVCHAVMAPRKRNCDTCGAKNQGSTKSKGGQHESYYEEEEDE